MIQLPAAHFNNTHFFNYEMIMTTKTLTSNLCKFQLENISKYEFFAWFHVHGIVPGKRLNFPNINKRHWREWMEDTKKKYPWEPNINEIITPNTIIESITTEEIISISPLWTFHLYVATFQLHLHMDYISLSWYDIPELVVPIRISLIEGYC